MSIELKNIYFEVKDKTILEDVSFKIEDGEFVSLLGASGAGKSTTIKIIAGILGQTRGSVLIDGKVVDEVPANKRKVSVAFQDMRLFPNMTVGENVAFPMRMQGVKKKERIELADYYLDMVQLKGFGSRKVDEISGGQQQRVALARAVAAKPRVLLLDEPFSGLDENLRDGMRAIVRDLHNKLGMTTAMITHDATEALTMSNHIIYMTNGKVVQCAVPTELYDKPASADVALCFGNALDIVGTVEGGVFTHGSISFPADCADGPATAVLRYEGIHLVPQADSNVVVKDRLFGGEWNQVILESEGRRLALTTKDPIELGTRVVLALDEGSYFVYPGADAVQEDKMGA